MIWPPLLPVLQYSHSPRFQVRSRSYLVSRGVYPFVLALPLAQKEYWDTTRSHANAQNQGVGGRGKGMYWDWPLRPNYASAFFEKRRGGNALVSVERPLRALRQPSESF